MDPPAAGQHRAFVAGEARVRDPRRRGERQRRGRRGCPRLEQLQPVAQRLVALARPQRLEPPATVGIQSQQMVVERELERRQPGRAWRARADRLDAPPELVAEVPEPAAADGVPGVPGVRFPRECRLLIE
jgi:hypothetical protein